MHRAVISQPVGLKFSISVRKWPDVSGAECNDLRSWIVFVLELTKCNNKESQGNSKYMLIQLKEMSFQRHIIITYYQQQQQQQQRWCRWRRWRRRRRRRWWWWWRWWWVGRRKFSLFSGLKACVSSFQINFCHRQLMCSLYRITQLIHSLSACYCTYLLQLLPPPKDRNMAEMKLVTSNSTSKYLYFSLACLGRSYPFTTIWVWGSKSRVCKIR